MRSKVPIHSAETDEWFPQERAKELEQNMKAAGVDVTLQFYPGRAHRFMGEDRPEYDPAASEPATDCCECDIQNGSYLVRDTTHSQQS